MSVVIPSGVEESVNVSDCSLAAEIVRDVSTSLDMTRLRTVALVFFCAITCVWAQAPSSQKSIVYSTHDADAIADYKTNPRVVRAMVDRLVLAATGQPDLPKAWGSLVSPNDKVGIKISAAGGELSRLALRDLDGFELAARDVRFVSVRWAGSFGL